MYGTHLHPFSAIKKSKALRARAKAAKQIPFLGTHEHPLAIRKLLRACGPTSRNIN